MLSENNDAPGKGTEDSMRLTVCALHSFTPLSPGTLSKYISILRGVPEPFVRFPGLLSKVARHSSLWECFRSFTFLRPVRGKA